MTTRSDQNKGTSQSVEEKIIMVFKQGGDGSTPVAAICILVPGMPIVVNHNTHQGLKVVNCASDTALEVILDTAYPSHWMADMVLHFGLLAGSCSRPRRRTSFTPERVSLELRGMRVTNVGGQIVPSQCDPYSLHVQLSRCPSLDGIMLVFKVRKRDLVGNMVPKDMTAAGSRLGELSCKTIEEAADPAGCKGFGKCSAPRLQSEAAIVRGVR